MTNTVFRLHALSWIFHCGKAVQKLAFPMLPVLIFGRQVDDWQKWASLGVVFIVGYSILSARAYRLEFGDGELLIREGVFDKRQRHIPFTRIQSVSQRRKLVHRLLGVTEVQLDSAAGSKPEAVMKVLSLPAATALEELLRQAEGGALAPAAAVDEKLDATLHAMPAGEILRFGIVSNRGAVLFSVAMGALFQHDSPVILKFFSHLPHQWLTAPLRALIAEGHWLTLALAVLMIYAAAFVVFRILSVVLAFLRYHGFKLELHGDRLTAIHGLSTEVRSGTRLQRLQRFVLQEGWLHRRLGRCRLAVDAVGAHDHDEHMAEASAKFTELAPIATRAQADALLRRCLPELDWQALVWRPLHANALKRRLMVQARWMVPTMLGLTWLDDAYRWFVPMLDLAIVFAVASAAIVLYNVAWLRFSALAESGDLLVFRSGVWRRNWVIVRASRVQNLNLVTAPLDRTLGLVQLEVDIQAGPRGHRAMVIPCLAREEGEALRARLWQRVA
jgi:putative membrane protein